MGRRARCLANPVARLAGGLVALAVPWPSAWSAAGRTERDFLSSPLCPLRDGTTLQNHFNKLSYFFFILFNFAYFYFRVHREPGLGEASAAAAEQVYKVANFNTGALRNKFS